MPIAEDPEKNTNHKVKSESRNISRSVISAEFALPPRIRPSQKQGGKPISRQHLNLDQFLYICPKFILGETAYQSLVRV